MQCIPDYGEVLTIAVVHGGSPDSCPTSHGTATR